jgi:hypothetical protein
MAEPVKVNNIECPACHETHPDLMAGQRYRISADDCCLSIDGLIATFVGWKPEPSFPGRTTPEDPHYDPIFGTVDGSFTMGEKWAMTGWDIEKV